MSKTAKPSRQKVYTLLVEIGRKEGDGLPKDATGGALMIYASGVDEAEAVRETVAILKQADLAPLDVTGYGTLEERLAEGHDIRISFDRSTSQDEDKWSWNGDDAYNHYRVEYMTSWKGFDFNLAAEDTSMDTDNSDTRAVLSVSRTFAF